MLVVWLCNLFGRLSVVFCVQTPAEKPLGKSRGQTEPGKAPVERLSEETHTHSGSQIITTVDFVLDYCCTVAL